MRLPVRLALALAFTGCAAPTPPPAAPESGLPLSVPKASTPAATAEPSAEAPPPASAETPPPPPAPIAAKPLAGKIDGKPFAAKSAVVEAAEGGGAEKSITVFDRRVTCKDAAKPGPAG